MDEGDDKPPAFERPGGEESEEAGARPIDFAHLARQTMGDRALEQEVLGLFIHQATAIAERLGSAGREERLQLAHKLVGSSRGVGAFQIAGCAAALERAPDDAALVRRLERLVIETAEVVASISR